MKRCLIILGVIFLSMSGTNLFAQNFAKNEYQKALWMTTRMYGGQRSGEGPNWLIMTHEVSATDKATLKQHKGFVEDKYQPFKCFTDDADGDHSLSGGWVDCGDHVKFGQTMFYAGYMLAFAYSEFPEGFDDYYSWNYEGYKSFGDFTWEGKKGKPNGIPDILDEVKYETDFFIKCARNATTFYSQVGMGDPDHLNWVSSVAMAALPKTQGGQANGARDIRKNPNDCVMPAMCAATLAVMSRIYKKFDPEYAALCLKHAEYAYAYAKSKKGLTEAATGGSFYPAKSNWEDSYAIMLAEMYRATETLSYKTEALTYGKLLHNHNWTLCYNNCDDIAAYLLATYGDTDAKTLLETLVAGYKKDANTDSVFMRGPSWGALRYTASQAFAAALLSKLNGETKINRYTLKTVEFIMGKNSKNLSFIVGYGANHAKRPHHRNYYSSDNIAAKQNDLPVPTKNAQFGYLVGGAKDPAAFNDQTEDYQSTEGGIDYNAGLVGALGYLVSKIAPVDVNKFGHPTPELGETKTLCGVGSVTLTATIDLSNLEAGEQISYKWYKGTSTTPFEQGADKKSVVITQADEYICEVVEVGNKWKTSDRVLVTAALPDVDLGSTVNLCESVYATLDAKIAGAGINYTWKKNSTEIQNSNARTYTAYDAGTYTVEVAASGCTSKTASLEITSSLPTVKHDTICAAGQAELEILTTGNFEWYDAPVEGKLISKELSILPNITANMTYYVQDASSIAITTGPKSTTFTTGVNWGNIGAKFSAKTSFTITEITVKPFAIYNNEPVSITLKLIDNGVAIGTYTSDVTANNGVTNYVLKFSTPIEIPRAGSYILEPTAGLTPLFYESGPAYSTYSNYPEIINFEGATNGTATNNPFPAMFDWKISAGSTCSRTPVFALINPTGNCEKDTDGDGTPDSQDECPNDPLKILAGLCGCSVSEASCGIQTLALQKGWNLVALSVLPENDIISSIFSTVISKIEVVKDENSFFKYGQSDFMNSLKTLAPHKAYLIKATEACTLSISGTPIENVSKELKKGWNLFGYSLSESIEMSDFFSTIWNNSFEVIKNFDGFNDKSGGTLNFLTPGEGYFIKLSTDATINR